MQQKLYYESFELSMANNNAIIRLIINCKYNDIRILKIKTH